MDNPMTIENASAPVAYTTAGTGFATGVKFQPGANDNMLFARKIAANLKVNDQGTNNHLYGDVS